MKDATILHDPETQLRQRCAEYERENARLRALVKESGEMLADEAHTIQRLRAAIEEALEDLNSCGERGFTNAIPILRKALGEEG